MSLAALPVTVVGGYLGSGKTTLINRLLREADGRRIMVLVNDFGDINIDAELLESRSEDTIALTNGCVCCTMGGDLFMALGDALDRRPRPDVLVIEASGVADPRRIAEAAKAEPDLVYGGIVTLVDSVNFEMLAGDSLIGRQVRDQIACADLLAVSKCESIAPELEAALGALASSPAICVNASEALADVLLTPSGSPQTALPAGAHGHFGDWSYRGAAAFSRDALFSKLSNPPSGAFRIKGFVRGPENAAWEVHVVGETVDIRSCEARDETKIVVIGPLPGFDPVVAEQWWNEG